MSKLIYNENPTEADFPMIDRCVVCDEVCSWQPRYEIACRSAIHNQLLATFRPVEYVNTYRTVKICGDCLPEGQEAVCQLVRKHYPVYAAEKGI